MGVSQEQQPEQEKLRERARGQGGRGSDLDKYPTQDPDLLQLADVNPEGTAYVDSSAVEELEQITPTDIYEGDTDVTMERVDGQRERFDLPESRELRRGETDDVMEAIEEGYTYVPPIDPPIGINPEEPETVEMAVGTGLDTRQPGFSESAPAVEHLSDGDMVRLVRRALRADSSTQHLADRLRIVVVERTAILRGMVDDLDDTDSLVAVVSEVPGIDEVCDETEVAGL